MESWSKLSNNLTVPIEATEIGTGNNFPALVISWVPPELFIKFIPKPLKSFVILVPEPFIQLPITSILAPLGKFNENAFVLVDMSKVVIKSLTKLIIAFVFNPVFSIIHVSCGNG